MAEDATLDAVDTHSLEALFAAARREEREGDAYLVAGPWDDDGAVPESEDRLAAGLVLAGTAGTAGMDSTPTSGRRRRTLRSPAPGRGASFPARVLYLLAALEAAGGDSVRALRLGGSAIAALTLTGPFNTARVSACFEPYLEPARRALTWEAAAAAWAEGEAMSPYQALAYALEVTS